MSIVTGVLVVCSVADEDRFADINRWLTKHDESVLRAVSNQSWGGNKHPQFDVLGGGINYFGSKVEEFAAFVRDLPWEWPENVVIILQPEEGPTKVIRPPVLS